MRGHHHSHALPHQQPYLLVHTHLVAEARICGRLVHDPKMRFLRQSSSNAPHHNDLRMLVPTGFPHQVLGSYPQTFALPYTEDDVNANPSYLEK